MDHGSTPPKDAAAGVQPVTEEIVFDGEMPDSEILVRGQYPSVAWLHYPAQLEFLSISSQRLIKVNERRNGVSLMPDRVRAAVVTPAKILYIIPAMAREQSGIPVTKGRYVNLRKLLAPKKLLVDPGYRELFAVEYAEDSRVGFALKIDLNHPLEKEREPEPKKKPPTKKTDTTSQSPEA